MTHHDGGGTQLERNNESKLSGELRKHGREIWRNIHNVIIIFGRNTILYSNNSSFHIKILKYVQ